MKLRTFFAFALLAATLPAKDKPRIQIEIVDSERSDRPVSYTVAGTNGQSNTYCTGSATATSAGSSTTANGTTNCNTTSTPGIPPRTIQTSLARVNVKAILPDGRHITLACQQGGNGGFNLAGALTGNPAAHFGSGCSNLAPGTYDAVLDGNSAYIYGHDLSGKEHKTKFLYTGGWQ